MIILAAVFGFLLGALIEAVVSDRRSHATFYAILEMIIGLILITQF